VVCAGANHDSLNRIFATRAQLSRPVNPPGNDFCRKCEEFVPFDLNSAGVFAGKNVYRAATATTSRAAFQKKSALSGAQ